eukprot:PhM_4_TR2397/c0_g1_i2/m.61204
MTSSRHLTRASRRETSASLDFISDARAVLPTQSSTASSLGTSFLPPPRSCSASWRQRSSRSTSCLRVLSSSSIVSRRAAASAERGDPAPAVMSRPVAWRLVRGVTMWCCPLLLALLSWSWSDAMKASFEAISPNMRRRSASTTSRSTRAPRASRGTMPDGGAVPVDTGLELSELLSIIVPESAGSPPPSASGASWGVGSAEPWWRWLMCWSASCSSRFLVCSASVRLSTCLCSSARREFFEFISESWRSSICTKRLPSTIVAGAAYSSASTGVAPSSFTWVWSASTVSRRAHISLARSCSTSSFSAIFNA